ncbi:MAG: hypothetical protein JWP46_360 [Modestobacter sp.]|nr:hypothetical protein [Modestobacter sp.]
MHLIAMILAGITGVLMVATTALSAAQTLIVPRGTPMMITRWVFVAFGWLFGLQRTRADYRARDKRLALYAPMALLSLPVVWLVLVLAGFMLIFWASGQTWDSALLESGSSLLTLGFRTPPHAWSAALVFAEAVLGLSLMALLISYLPSIYNSYSRREAMVTSLESQAGTPPSGADLLTRFADIQGLEQLQGFWPEWTRWFAELEETHSSSPSLVFFRSPQPDRSWVTAAGAVLDAAALTTSALDIPRQPPAELCIRAGYLALRRIGDFFVMPYDPHPSPTDPISIRREEFDAVCARLAEVGAPVRTDREQAWRDFAGWRVTYDAVLLRFASLCWAAEAPWSSDRAIAFHRAPIGRRRARTRI